MSWTKIILIVGTFQILFVPIMWKDFIPLKKSSVNMLRIASVFLFAPVYLLLSSTLHPTSDESFMVAILIAACAALQGVVLILIHQYNKDRLREAGIADSENR